jgi:hypothetical protein
MKTIKQTVTLYSKASEHHILGYRTLRRGWCVHHNQLHRVLFTACHSLTRSGTVPANRLVQVPVRAERAHGGEDVGGPDVREYQSTH